MPLALLPTVFLTLTFITLLTTFLRAILAPLRKIPGPAHTLLTPVPLIVQEFSSNRRMHIHQLHQKYGPVVRIAPSEVSFTSLAAVREIYASSGSGFDKTGLYTLFMQFGTKSVRSAVPLCK